jgi:DNA-directed RNA polymerase specialized sigma24 family protein
MTRDTDPGAGHPDGGAEGDTSAPVNLASEEGFSRFFEETFEMTVAWTLKHFKQLARDRSTAEDAVMVAFEKLHAERESLGGISPVVFLQNRIRTVLVGAARLPEERRRGGSLDEAIGMIDPEARPADSILKSRECRELFSEEAVGSLSPEELRLYKLYLEERTYQEMADVLRIPKRSVRWQLGQVMCKLFQAMARLTTIASPHQLTLSSDLLVLSTPENARRAVEKYLPRLLSDVVRLVHVEKVPPRQVVARLNLGTTDELAMHLKRAYRALEIVYKAPMPDALIEALNHKDPRKD